MSATEESRALGPSPDRAREDGLEGGLDEGPYGPRGKDTPPLANMFGGYAVIFMAVALVPLLLFLLIRFVLL